MVPVKRNELTDAKAGVGEQCGDRLVPPLQEFGKASVRQTSRIASICSGVSQVVACFRAPDFRAPLGVVGVG